MFVTLATLLLVITAASAAPSAPPTTTTDWEGTMHRGGSELRVRFEFTQGPSNLGTFWAPDVGAVDIPLSDVRFGHELRWKLVGDTSATQFDATVHGDSMAGTFTEPNEPTGTLTLLRTTDTMAKPYVTEPVTFTNGPVRLAGTVFSPRSGGKHPAAVLVQGSGPEGHWALAYIADYLARHGMVALTYDKRGVAGSTGDWRTATMQNSIADARGAVDVLARRDDVDPKRLGVYGHSQGGELAPGIAADNPKVKWIIAADAPVGPEYRQDIFRVDTMLAKDLSGKDLADAETLYVEFVDVARNGAPHTALRANIKKAGKAAWLDDLGIPDDSSWVWAWYRGVGNYDNSAAWGRVTVPVLLVFGAQDELVPPQQTVMQTTRILKDHGNQDVTVRIFPRADHTLHIPPTATHGWAHIPPGLLETIASFAQSATSSSSSLLSSRRCAQSDGAVPASCRPRRRFAVR